MLRRNASRPKTRIANALRPSLAKRGPATALARTPAVPSQAAIPPVGARPAPTGGISPKPPNRRQKGTTPAALTQPAAANPVARRRLTCEQLILWVPSEPKAQVTPAQAHSEVPEGQGPPEPSCQPTKSCAKPQTPQRFLLTPSPISYIMLTTKSGTPSLTPPSIPRPSSLSHSLSGFSSSPRSCAAPTRT